MAATAEQASPEHCAPDVCQQVEDRGVGCARSQEEAPLAGSPVVRLCLARAPAGTPQLLAAGSQYSHTVQQANALVSQQNPSFRGLKEGPFFVVGRNELWKSFLLVASQSQQLED